MKNLIIYYYYIIHFANKKRRQRLEAVPTIDSLIVKHPEKKEEKQNLGEQTIS